MSGHKPWSEIKRYPSGQPFRDWIDFYDRVVVPYIEREDVEAINEALRLFHTASPEFILGAFYLARKAEP